MADNVYIKKCKTWENFFFTGISDRAVCLLCGFEPSTVSTYVLQRHYKTRHSREYSVYEGREKSDLIEGLKLVCKEGRGEQFDSASTSSEKAIAASYAISHLIAKNSKPFTEGEFVKQCFIETIKSFGGSVTLQEATSIPLNRKTVASRISDISVCIEEKLSTLLRTSSYFSLCLDESTDNRHVSQLSIFVRIVQNDFSYIEELLDFVPMHGTTTGADIFKALEESLQKFNVDFSKCSAVVTDGAKAMTGSNVGLHGQFKKRNLMFPLIHCIIHQEVLCGKDVKLSFAMAKVTKIINAIKGGQKFLSHRKFKEFLQNHKAAYTDIPLHCEVRWLSAAKCLTVFFTLRKEILLFLKENTVPNGDEYQSLLEDLDFLSELAIITDLTSHLNFLNLRLQKPGQTVCELVSFVDSFRRKLALLKNHLMQNSLHFYASCQILYDEYGNDCNFEQYIYFIDSIIDQFNKRFSDFETLRTELILFENPLTVKIEEQNILYQEELCDLQSDLSLKAKDEKGVDFFKHLSEIKYPKLRDFSRRIFSMFGSTYLCECSFSKMKLIKSEKRSSLNDSSLASLMRTATSTIPIDASSFPTSSKRMRKSH